MNLASGLQVVQPTLNHLPHQKSVREEFKTTLNKGVMLLTLLVDIQANPVVLPRTSILLSTILNHQCSGMHQNLVDLKLLKLARTKHIRQCIVACFITEECFHQQVLWNY